MQNMLRVGRSPNASACFISRTCEDCFGLRPRSTRFIRGLSQFVQKTEECRRLPDKQPHVREKIHHAHSNSVGLCRPNDRTNRQTRANEWAWLGHDEVCLKILSPEWRRIEVGKCRRVVIHRIKGSDRWCIAGFVLPRLEMHCFRGTDADQNPQNFGAGGPLSHRWIEAVSALFDCCKVESCSIRDHLKKIRIAGVSICPWNRGVLPVR